MDGNKIQHFIISVVSGAFFEDENTTNAILMKDITEKMELEEIRIADQSKNMILCGFSHELRNPLNEIVGRLILLKRSVGEKMLKTEIKNVISSSKFLQYKIGDILDYAEFSQNNFKIHRTCIDLFQCSIIK